MFALTDRKKRMPLDPVPDPAGNVYVRWEGGKMRCTVVSAEHPNPEGVAHLPHFATCTAGRR